MNEPILNCDCAGLLCQLTMSERNAWTLFALRSEVIWALEHAQDRLVALRAPGAQDEELRAARIQERQARVEAFECAQLWFADVMESRLDRVRKAEEAQQLADRNSALKPKAVRQ